MPKCIFAKCIRLACLLSFASLLFTLPTISHFKYPLWHWTLSRYKHFWANDHKLITYDRLITDHTNGEYLGNFDVEAGTFTAGTPGSLSQYLWTTHILVKTGQYSVDFSSSVPYNTLNDYIEVLGREKKTVFSRFSSPLKMFPGLSLVEWGRGSWEQVLVETRLQHSWMGPWWRLSQNGDFFPLSLINFFLFWPWS